MKQKQRADEPMTDRLVFLTTADTEILAAAKAGESLPEGFPEVLCANPTKLEDPPAFFKEALPGAGAVVVRLLGGRRAWPGGFEELVGTCEELEVPLLAFGGESEPDAELTALSTVPSGAIAEAFEYLRHGGVRNTENLFRFVADTVLFEGYGFEPAVELPELGVYHPRLPEGSPLEDLLASHDAERPTVGIIFYRAHWMGGNTAFIDTLVGALEDGGVNALPVYCYSLRADNGEAGEVPALEMLKGRVDCLVTTVLASGGSNAADARQEGSPEGWLEWEVPALDSLGVPVVQGICSTSSREAWLSSEAGLSPLDTAWQVAIPEFDGRVIGVPFSFKERVATDSTVGAPLTLYKADPERTKRLAGLAARFARL
ncbi:MAG TPA: cobaltochelatase subunit CobN, partial [Rubrobacteraceae bacterium]|nr:cobaltochelatase subunit CobN [Rubrobacteraceae bacterium]